MDPLLKDVRVFSIEFIKLLAGQGLYSLKKYYVYIGISLVNKVPDLYSYIAYLLLKYVLKS